MEVYDHQYYFKDIWQFTFQVYRMQSLIWVGVSIDLIVTSQKKGRPKKLWNWLYQLNCTPNDFLIFLFLEVKKLVINKKSADKSWAKHVPQICAVIMKDS